MTEASPGYFHRDKNAQSRTPFATKLKRHDGPNRKYELLPDADQHIHYHGHALVGVDVPATEDAWHAAHCLGFRRRSACGTRSHSGGTLVDRPLGHRAAAATDLSS